MEDSWNWCELTLTELGTLTEFRELRRRNAGQGPTGLITRMDALPGVVVLNLLAPRNAAFWSACRPVLLADNDKYLREQGFWSDPLARKLLLRDIRSSGIEVSDPGLHLFRGLVPLLSNKARVIPWFDGVSLGSSYLYRWHSFAFLEDLLPRVQAFFEQEADQFGTLAFLAVDDRIGLYWSDNGAQLRDPWQFLFRRWRLSGLSDAERLAWWRELQQRLAYAVEMASTGAVFDIPLPTQHLISPGLSFFLGTEMVGGVDEVSEPVCRSVLSHRARLVRLLGWPVFYDGVRNALEVASTNAPRELDSYGRFEPWDVVEELEAYKREVEARYPCLLDNPWHTATPGLSVRF